jgi:zinc transport system permease protein
MDIDMNSMIFDIFSGGFFEIFQYGFMVRAFIAGAMIGVMAPAIGSFLVTRRYALMADTLSHISLAGIALGLLIGVEPIFSALAVSIVAALIMEKLRAHRQLSGDTALAMFLSGGLALAVVLMSLGKGFNVDIFSYLFGSITTVREIDVWVITGLGAVVLSTLWFLYDKLLYISFNEEAARVSGISTTKLNTILIILTATTVSLAMRVVGVLLVGALMVIPVITAMQLARSFRQVMILAMSFGLVAVLVGLLISFYGNLAAGGTIVLVCLFFFAVSAIFRRK